MNVFYLDSDPKKCAEYHHDGHVKNGKMALEGLQICSDAMHVLGLEAPYKKYNINAPHVKWVLQSRRNYSYLITLIYNLLDERLYRTTIRSNKLSNTASFVWSSILYRELPDAQFTEPPLVMQGKEDKYALYTCNSQFKAWHLCWPSECIDYSTNCELRKIDTVKSYRNYYRNEKRTDKNGKKMDFYTNRERPTWFPEIAEDCANG